MAMVQYGVWPNCNNNCRFCLRTDRIPISKEKQFKQLEMIRANLDLVDWKDQFQHGISLLGGEIYCITDKDLQEAFLELIDDIINKVLKVSPFPAVKYSTVTNGIYDPTFLFKCIDKIVDAVGLEHVDLNVSYDLKYRYANEQSRLLALNTINSIHKRYNYRVGVQMILTQYLINYIKEGKFNITQFEKEVVPGNIIALLYPHKLNPQLPPLPDFFFTQDSFLDFIIKLKETNPTTFFNFKQSVQNSSIFKWTGFMDKTGGSDQKPTLAGKNTMNPECGHSDLYQCYTDCKDCLLCDLELL